MHRAVALPQSIARVLWLCFLEARPAVQGIFLLRFLAGASFAEAIWHPGTWAAAAIWACGAWSVYLLNGVTDVTEDRFNASGRPVARGLLDPREATAVVAILAATSLLGAALADAPPLWCVAVSFALGWAYSAPPLRLKRWPLGLVAVVMPAALLTYHAGYLANGGAGVCLELLVFAAVMALWMALVGQTKDLSDAEGDAQAGRRSLPVAWGEDAARVAYSAAALLLGTAYALWAVLSGGDLPPSALSVLIGASVLAVVTLGPWGKGGSRSERRRPYNVFMVTQYAANAAIMV
jgi:4-hydroxybenzoate polyprenyltransferase